MSERPFIPQANPGASYLAQKAAIDAAIARVLESGRYILGEEVSAFEKAFAEYLDVEFCVGVASGTDAIELALRALEIGAGQAVICPSHTAVATVAAIEGTGARPVLIDVDPTSYTITALAVEAAARTRRTADDSEIAAVIPVHLYGRPADMPAILDVARRHKLRVIEDCAQSHGAQIGSGKAGTFGDLAAFSFYPTKNLGALGDGGLVAANDPELRERLIALREYGWQTRYVSSIPGGMNSRLDSLQAAILNVKLSRLDADNDRRRAIAARYSAGLANLELGLPRSAAAIQHVFHQYVIRSSDRDGLSSFLASRGIGTGVHYPVPVHLQPAYRERRLNFGALAETEKLCDEILSLPMFPQLADADIDRVIATIAEWSRARRPDLKGAAT
jgi:dTDP-4-amino-4,6-dideoxygalactose transaminase